MMKERKFDNIFKKFVNGILDNLTEQVEEVPDNGLKEDNVDTTSIFSQPHEGVLNESVETKEVYSKVNPTNYSSANTSEMNNNLAHLLKTTPETSSSIAYTEEVEDVTMDTFPVYDDTKAVAEDKKEMTREELFDYHLSIREKMIVGFSDACFDTIAGIQSSSVLSQETKIKKIKNLEDEFLSISDNDFASVSIFFKKVKHELHMIENNVGEYDARVYTNGLINDPRIKNYKMVELYMDNSLYTYMTKEDKEVINKLLDTCEEIHRRAKVCNRLSSYVKETERIIMSCNTIVDTLNAEEKFGEMLMDLNVEINTSGGNTLLA